MFAAHLLVHAAFAFGLGCRRGFHQIDLCVIAVDAQRCRRQRITGEIQSGQRELRRGLRRRYEVNYRLQHRVGGVRVECRVNRRVTGRPGRRRGGRAAEQVHVELAADECRSGVELGFDDQVGVVDPDPVAIQLIIELEARDRRVPAMAASKCR